MSEQKRIFKISNNGVLFPVCAGGIILYRIENKELQLLLMCRSAGCCYEDLGGKSQFDDQDIYQTVAREAEEESNGLINRNSVFNRIKQSEFIISEKCKYVLFVVRANNKEVNLKSEQFGDKEIHENLPRTVDWVTLSEFTNYIKLTGKLNFRLRNRKLYQLLKQLDPNKTISDAKSKNTVYLF